MTGKLRFCLLIALGVSAASLVRPPVFAQDAPPAPLDRAEILGRLAYSYPPSYVAELVSQRGLRFSVTADFLYRVKLAGGDGILVETLSAAQPATAAAAADDASSVDHLAKCAELLRTGADDSAQPECKSAIGESPKSPWPLLIVAASIKYIPYGQDTDADRQKKADQLALLQQATALDPSLIAVQRLAAQAQMSYSVAGQGSVAMKDAEQLTLGQREAMDGRDFQQAFEDDPPAEPGAPGFTATEESEAIPPDLIRKAQDEPDLAGFHISLAAYYQTYNFPDKAVAQLREALRLEPDNPGVHVSLGQILLKQHKSEAGLAEFREAIRIVPYGSREHLMLAAALERLGRNREAVAEMQTTIAIRPSDVELSEAFVALYLKHDELKSAIGELRRSLGISMDSGSSEADAVRERTWDQRNLANLLREDRQFAAAGEQYLYLLRFSPDNSDLHNDYGNVLLDQHNCDAAIAEYYEALRLSPEASTPHHNIGVCLMQKKDADGAIAEFRKTLELNPEEPNTRIFLASELGQKGDLREANEQLQQVLAKNPQDAGTRLNVAYAMMQIKDESGAITQLLAALKLQPDSPGAENDLAWMYCTAEDHKLRNLGQALVLARRAVAATSASPNPAFLDTLAEAQFVNGQQREALATETRALALDPNNSEYNARLEHFRGASTSVASAKP